MNILLVEDNVKFARNLKRALEIEGYNVDTAYDGESGFRKGKSAKYDLIILDIMLPKKDGVEVCRELRYENTQIPIIMLTARGSLDDRVTGLDAGADDYLIKPFGFDELFARLRSLLRRKKTTDPPLLQTGDLVLNPATHEVKRGGKAIALGPKEYKLLEHLLRNQHKIVSRTELTALLWKSKPKGNDLDVHIRYLRKKIDSDHGKKLIHTLRRAGYQIK